MNEKKLFLFGNIESSGICGKEVQVGSYKQISRVVLRVLNWKPLFYKLIHLTIMSPHNGGSLPAFSQFFPPVA